MAPSGSPGYRGGVYDEERATRVTGLARSADPLAEQRIEVGRYTEALRRSWLLVVLIVVVATASALVTTG